ARVARTAVATESHGIVQLGVRKVGIGAVNVVDTELREGMPVANGDVDVDQRHFDAEGERLFLRVGQLRHDVRNDHVVAGEHALLGLNSVQSPCAHVTDIHGPAGCAVIGDGYGRAVQAQTNRRAIDIELG